MIMVIWLFYNTNSDIVVNGSNVNYCLPIKLQQIDTFWSPPDECGTAGQRNMAKPTQQKLSHFVGSMLGQYRRLWTNIDQQWVRVCCVYVFDDHV